MVLFRNEAVELTPLYLFPLRYVLCLALSVQQNTLLLMH